MATSCVAVCWFDLNENKKVKIVWCSVCYDKFCRFMCAGESAAFLAGEASGWRKRGKWRRRDSSGRRDVWAGSRPAKFCMKQLDG